MILKNYKKIYLRDYESIETIYNLTKNMMILNKLEFCPDVAFLLNPIKPDKLNIRPWIKQDNYGNYIGLSTTALLYYCGCNKSNILI